MAYHTDERGNRLSAQSRTAQRLRGSPTRKITPLPRGGNDLFIEPDRLTADIQTMLDHNRDRFAKHFNYADEYGSGDPNSYDDQGDYNCGRCNQASDGDCLLIKKNKLDLEAGSCRQWESIRSGDPEMFLQRESVTAGAYGVAQNGKGFGCARCPYSKPAKNRDDRGRIHWCGYGGFHQTPTACCELNGAATV